jgi:dihydroorotate dehydrogenase electron transfer subunit
VVNAHETAGEGIRRLAFSLPRWDGEEPAPGQFLMMRVGTGNDPLLGRPFGFSGFSRIGAGAEAEIYYRVAGRGTAMMAEWSVGDRISFLGPLGRGFPLPEEDEEAVLVAGGIGLPPLLFLARFLAGRGVRGVGGRISVLFGGPARRALAGLPALEALPLALTLATEDGSAGRKALVTEPLRERDLARAVVYACGPAPMLAAVHALVAGRCRRAFLSLEARMACGFGVCAGCAVRVRPPAGSDPALPAYHRACKEGPVFDAADLVPESFAEPSAAAPGGCR